MLLKYLLASATSFFATKTLADTPAECRYNDLVGTWKFHFTKAGQDNSIQCVGQDRSDQALFSNSLEVEFSDVNKITRLDTNVEGFFTLIYNQGFEAIINERRWFAFFESSLIPYTYQCNLTAVGWVHDNLGDDWACFYGERISQPETDSNEIDLPVSVPLTRTIRSESDKPEILKNLSKRSNNQNTANIYHPGHKTSRKNPRPIKSWKELENDVKRAIRTIKKTDQQLSGSLPASFDWNDLNMVSPVKNQLNCGSCYAFASVGMFEARARVQTNNHWQPLFSEQEITSCSDYSQGCRGGFPYLISKYGQDFGIVDESCYEYNATDRVCKALDPIACPRWRISNYGYIGDYYGGASEYLIRKEVYENGPVAVSLDATDLHSYESGIWYPEAEQDALSWDPFVFTNHVVLITGWGWDDETGLPFWNIKNSWGEDFGYDGYFHCMRGVDSIGVESLPAKCTMIPPL